jgi:CheY-like chemotaxis protein
MALLIVDDEESNRDMLSRRLQRHGFEVVMAEDGHQALDSIRQQTPDVVLLDIRMPGMSGMEVLQTIREQYSATQLPVIMVTAEGQSASIVEALRIGANDYITKPVDLPVVLARIRTVLSQKTLSAALRESEDRYARAALERRLVGLGSGERRNLLLAPLEGDARIPGRRNRAAARRMAVPRTCGRLSAPASGGGGALPAGDSATRLRTPHALQERQLSLDAEPWAGSVERQR